METLPATLSREQSRPEEIANSLSHGAGVVAALVGTPILLVRAVRHGDAAFIVGVSVFSTAILLLYFSSTIYHALPAGKSKRVLRVIDHSFIYLLIAGTYTPFTLGVLRGASGVGVALKAWGRASNVIVSTTLYLLMGWVVVVALKPLLASVPTPGLLWLLAGGLSYTLGVVFFALGSRLRYGHLVWHCFVLAGTACHYLAVLWYAA